MTAWVAVIVRGIPNKTPAGQLDMCDGIAVPAAT